MNTFPPKPAYALPPTVLIPPKTRIPKHYLIKRGKLYDLDRKPVEPSGASVLVEAMTFHGDANVMRKTTGKAMTPREKATALVKMAQAHSWMD